ncbi:hypothetical protein [Paenibacillus cremeus]|nr:hypothetical protein [Paenibacillus cremeus]
MYRESKEEMVAYNESFSDYRIQVQVQPYEIRSGESEGTLYKFKVRGAR